MEEFEVIAPASPKQEMMLKQDCDFAILGGAAGSGKSFVLLLYPLKYSDDPYFRGIIFRKTTGEITGQGGLWETAIELYTKAFDGDIKIHKKEMRITFPSGASVKFSHMERAADRFRHQGNQYSFIGFDEGTHFDLESITYLQTRLRSARAKHKLQVVITCNPDPDWELLSFVKPYLDEEGTPNLAMDGVVRYYTMTNNEFVFADNIEDLQKRFGSGTDSGIKTYTFISGNCTDNPPLLKNVPGYVGELKAKPHVDMMRLLLGNWYVRPSGSQFYEREWVEEIDYVDPEEIVATVRSWDWAATMPSDMNRNPDFSASVRMHKMRDGTYVIDDVQRIRIPAGKWEDFVFSCAATDPSNTEYYMPLDPGASGKRAFELFARQLAEHGFYIKKLTTTQKKLERFRPFAAMAHAGGVKILKGCGTDHENQIFNDNNFYHKELEMFTGVRDRTKDGHDDMVDATSDSYYALASKKKLGNFGKNLSTAMADMRVPNSFK